MENNISENREYLTLAVNNQQKREMHLDLMEAVAEKLDLPLNNVVWKMIEAGVYVNLIEKDDRNRNKLTLKFKNLSREVNDE